MNIVRMWDHLFGDEEADVARAKAEQAQRAARITALVTTEGFRVDLKEWLASALEQYEVRPGREDAMLRGIGVRDGLRMVQHRLADLEAEARRSRDV